MPKSAKELKVGDRAPSLKLQSDAGTKVSLSDFSDKTVVLFFYPKDMTSGCTKEANDFQASLSKFTKKGAVILGISKDPLESHVKFKDKEGLKFSLLSDPDGKACEAFGVWKEKSMYGRKYMGIERTTFVINPGGKIKAVFNKVKVPGHVEAVLAEIG